MIDARAHRLESSLLTALLGLALAALLAGVGWLLGGATGALFTVAFAAALALFAPRPSAHRLLAARGARPLHPLEVPGLHDAVEALAHRAGLDAPPRLHLLPDPAPQALATDGHDGAVIGVTPALLRTLGPRQTLAVIAHEIAHLTNGDLAILRLARTVEAITASAARFSLYALVFGVPLLLFAGAPVPWSVFALLLVAPWAVRLLVAALSRARELAADATAAELTGDPVALASALERIERAAAPWWMRWFAAEIPVALRTHPPTHDRVARLLELERGRAYG